MGKSWFIPGNVPSSKNGKRWTGKHLISSKAVMKYRSATKNIFSEYKHEFIKEIAKYKKPVVIAFTYFRGSQHKFDYINPCETTQDDMVYNGWIEDDNANIILPMFKKYVYDSENPGVLIEIIDSETLTNELIDERLRSSGESNKDASS